MKVNYILDEDDKIVDVLIDSEYDGTEYVFNLNDALSKLMIENPAKVFAQKMRAGVYENLPDELVVQEAEAANKLSDAWESQPQMNVLSLLARLMRLYITEPDY